MNIAIISIIGNIESYTEVLRRIMCTLIILNMNNKGLFKRITKKKKCRDTTVIVNAF